VVTTAHLFHKPVFIINIVDSSSKDHELHDAQLVELAHLLAADCLKTNQGANQICTAKWPSEKGCSYFCSIFSHIVDSSSKDHELHDAQLVELAHLLAADCLKTSQGANQICTPKWPSEKGCSYFCSIFSPTKLFNALNIVN
jgi:hypothetical protein